MRGLLPAFLAWTLLAAAPCLAAPDPRLTELQSRIEGVLKDTGTPAAGIALVGPEGPIWIAGLGQADVEKQIAATPDTRFRIGSIGKMFVSLSVLKLVEEGRLDLNDKVRERAPEIAFGNPWEAIAPVRVVHLLEHTTGWEDLHRAEYAASVEDYASLRAALDFHPDSRVSRWQPGTRNAYSNSGPPVAAYLVERISAQRFEDYVATNFFKPLNMRGASYFRGVEASGYLRGVAQPYLHILYPSDGSINVSAREMAQLARFFIGRGSIDGQRLLTPASLARMERGETSLAVQAGARPGWGLGNLPEAYRGYQFHGHGGAIGAYRSDFGYLVDQGLAYVVMINSNSDSARARIVQLLRDYLLQGLPPAAAPPALAVLPPQWREAGGAYLNIAPRSDNNAILARLFDVTVLSSEGATLVRSNLFGKLRATYRPLSDTLAVGDDGGQIVRAYDPVAGPVIVMDDTVRRPLPLYLAYLQAGIALLCMASMVATIAYAPFWLLRWRRLPAPSLQVWPLAATALLAACAAMLVLPGEASVAMGTVSLASVALMLMSYAYAFSVLFALRCCLRLRHVESGRKARVFAIVVSVLHLITLLYLAYWGFVGVRSWA